MSHFIARPYQAGETIAAISTPPGEGGIAIVRISGREAVAIGKRLFSGPVERYASHTAHFGTITDIHGQKLDVGILLLFLHGRSYTGEETIELQCHGGNVMAQRVLAAALAAGARAALPGEFTFQAFLNGKIDLAQAEAVQTLIAARNTKAQEAAARHLEGALSKKISYFQRELTEIGAILEAWVDFPEEGLEFTSPEELLERLGGLLRAIQQLCDSFTAGKKLYEGISFCIVGAPNVGKSSLMNALLARERAIVTPIAGTTRDLLVEEFSLKGWPLQLIDTAGIRKTEDVIEREGIRRSREAMMRSELILLVLDSSRALEEEEEALLREAPRDRTLLLWNKSDLPCVLASLSDFPHQVVLSLKEGYGLEKVIEQMEALLQGGAAPLQEEVLLTSLRHKEALEEALGALVRVVEGLETHLSPEFLAQEMREALYALGKILGTDVSEEILSAIFSKFCIGK